LTVHSFNCISLSIDSAQFQLHFTFNWQCAVSTD